MKYDTLDALREEVDKRGYTLKQIQGFEQFEVWNDVHLIGRWNGHDGYIDTPEEKTEVEETPKETHPKSVFGEEP